MEKVLWSPRGLVDISNSYGWNTYIQSPFGTHNSSLESYQWKELFMPRIKLVEEAVGHWYTSRSLSLARSLTLYLFSLSPSSHLSPLCLLSLPPPPLASFKHFQVSNTCRFLSKIESKQWHTHWWQQRWIVIIYHAYFVWFIGLNHYGLDISNYKWNISSTTTRGTFNIIKWSSFSLF